MNIITCPTPADAAVKAAQFVLERVVAKRECVLGLPTGGTPLGMYAELAKAVRGGRADFSRVTTFNLDEYCGLPAGDPQSYREFMRVNFYEPCKLASANARIPDGNAADPAAEAPAYEAAIRAARRGAERIEPNDIDAAYITAVAGADKTGKGIIRHCDQGFGTPGSAEYALVKGKSYTFKLRHAGTDPAYFDYPNADYDWQCLINDSTAAGLCQGLYNTGPFIVEDPHNLLTHETQGNETNITLGKKGKIHVMGVGFMTGGAFRTNNLSVAKWEKAFKEDGNGVSFATPDFINTDVDNFRIFLNDARRTEATIEATLTQAGSIAGNRTVTLHRQPDGTYLSESLLIVASAEDTNDAALTALGALPDINQRMFQMALDDTLTVTYTHSGVTLTETATIGVDVKTLTVDVGVMTVGNKVCAEEDQVKTDLREARECLAPANIRIVDNYSSAMSPFNPPQSIAANPTSWYAADISTGVRRMTKEAHDVIIASDLELGTDRVRVIYVPFGVKGADGSAFQGIAFSDWAFTHKDDKTYLDTCFVTVKKDEHYAVPHEITHFFGIDHLLGLSWNLMEPWLIFRNGISGTKRLTQAQVDTIREDNRNKLK